MFSNKIGMYIDLGVTPWVLHLLILEIMQEVVVLVMMIKKLY